MARPHETPEPSFAERAEEAHRAIERKWALIALNGKVPVHKGWQKSTPATASEVNDWLQRGWNLGLRTGTVSGIVVLDDDSPDGSAAEGLDLPRTVTAITGSGKRHYYFKAPAFTVRNSVKTLAKGIDVRGDGGQVVFVGSVHPNTGKPYHWAPGLGPDEAEVAELPAPLLDKLLTKARPPKTKLALIKTRSADSPVQNATDIKTQACAILDREVDRVRSSDEGCRNDTLNKSAFAIGQLVGASHLDEKAAREALIDAAIDAGLPTTEANATVTSGLSAGTKNPLPSGPAATDVFDTIDDTTPDDRPIICLAGGWLHRATTRAEDVLLGREPPLLFQRGTVLVRVSMIPEAGFGRSIRRRATILEVTQAALVDKLTELIQWHRVDKDGNIRLVDCPERIAKTLLSRSGAWNLPALVGVIDAPTLRSDGTLLDREGYDPTSGLFLATDGQSYPPIPTDPGLDEAKGALGKLLLVLKDFPFVEDTDRAVAVAAILTALIRPSVRTAPLTAFRAAKMGSGKSLLADVVSLIATGRAAAVMSQGADENEDKKRMLPILAEGEPVAVIDNIERPFGSAALCSILTQPTWRDRVLGKSQTLSLPTTNTTWVATGNNIQFVGDISTRTLVCDLDPKCERPEERKFDVNLHHYVPRHRGELVVAGLTILRAYHLAGRPDQGLPVFGRFEEWSDWIRSAIVWIGMPDPCATRRRAEEADPVRAELGELLVALHEAFCEAAFKVSEVLDAEQPNGALAQAVSPILAAVPHGRSPGQHLGQFFHRMNRRPEGGLRLMRGATHGGSASWRVERV